MKDSSKLRGRRRFTASERRDWLRQYRRSGLTQAEFARQHALSHGTLVRWLCRDRWESSRSKPDASGFVELALPAANASDGWTAELTWPDGKRLKLSAAVSPSWVAELVSRSGPL